MRFVEPRLHVLQAGDFIFEIQFLSVAYKAQSLLKRINSFLWDKQPRLDRPTRDKYIVQVALSNNGHLHLIPVHMPIMQTVNQSGQISRKGYLAQKNGLVSKIHRHSVTGPVISACNVIWGFDAVFTVYKDRTVCT
jgi:hypothetical protein